MSILDDNIEIEIPNLVEIMDEKDSDIQCYEFRKLCNFFDNFQTFNLNEFYLQDVDFFGKISGTSDNPRFWIFDNTQNYLNTHKNYRISININNRLIADRFRALVSTENVFIIPDYFNEQIRHIKRYFHYYQALGLEFSELEGCHFRGLKKYQKFLNYGNNDRR